MRAAVETIMNEIVQAARGLRKSPALAAIAIASLALGIGANVTIYSVVREMIFDDISARQPERLARIDAGVSYARYRDLRHAGAFQDLAFQSFLGNLTWDTKPRPEMAWDMSTSAN